MYGNTQTTVILDNNGSTITSEENIVAGKINRPIRKRYELKVRVHSQQEEHEAYLKFSDDLANDKTKLDPAFRIDKTKLGNENGYYYVVNCYTQLEY